MKKYEALGVVETQYFTVAMELLDSICKSADVEFLTSENYLGGRLVTMIFGGRISDITVAIETAKQTANQKEKNPLKMAIVITNPHPEIMKYIIPTSFEPAIVEEKIIEAPVIEKSKATKPKKTTKRKTTKKDS